jgi:hypothetical protein
MDARLPTGTSAVGHRALRDFRCAATQAGSNRSRPTVTTQRALCDAESDQDFTVAGRFTCRA